MKEMHIFKNEKIDSLSISYTTEDDEDDKPLFEIPEWGLKEAEPICIGVSDGNHEYRITIEKIRMEDEE